MPIVYIYNNQKNCIIFLNNQNQCLRRATIYKVTDLQRDINNLQNYSKYTNNHLEIEINYNDVKVKIFAIMNNIRECISDIHYILSDEIEKTVLINQLNMRTINHNIPPGNLNTNLLTIEELVEFGIF
jgi:hypothetical protein